MKSKYRKQIRMFLIVTGTALMVGCNGPDISDDSNVSDRKEAETVVEIDPTDVQPIEVDPIETESIETESIDIQPIETDTAEPEVQELKFIDAWDEWHVTTILPEVDKHDYNWELLQNDGQNISYEHDEKYELVKGIDVSHHQGVIDWKKVKADGYDFAFIRMAYRGYGTAGVLNYDKNYKQNIQNAQDAGLDVGVYIFSQAINEEEAFEEAQFVINGLKEFSIEYPVVYDPELIRDDEARTDNVFGEQFTKNTQIFCEELKKNGYQVMVYSNMVWEAEIFDMNRIQQYDIWYADYEKVPQTPYQFKFWQYTADGKVDGIEGRVDLDVYFREKQ